MSSPTANLEPTDYQTHEPERTELRSDTLRRNYGDVTPYGTLPRQSSCEDHDDAEQIERDEIGRLSPTKDTATRRHVSPTMASSTGTMRSSGSQGTTLRRSKGGFYTRSEEEAAPMQNLGYIDFMPKKKHQSIQASKNYHGFSSCVTEANKFLEQNPHIQIKNCESLYQRLDHNHRVNPESTTSHDRSYVIGLRLWYSLPEVTENEVFVAPESIAPSDETQTTSVPTTSSSRSSDTHSNKERNARKLCYMNILPESTNKDKNTTTMPKHRDRPPFTGMKSTLRKLNEAISKNQITGHIINVESIPINYSHAFRDAGDLDPDHGYWCLDYHGRWNFFIIRVFYIEDKQVTGEYDIGFEDFSPSKTKQGDNVSFSGFSSLSKKASRWLSSEPGISIVGSQAIEIPFNQKQEEQKAFNTSCSFYETSKISAQLHTLKFLRIWFARGERQTVQSSSSETQIAQESPHPPLPRTFRPGIAIRTVLPCQITTAGCCGIRRPIFATTEDTIQRINEWIAITGADVICVQTDNIEKWRGQQCQLGKDFSEKTYNKADYSSAVAANSVEYRLAALRIFIRADSQGRFPEPETKELLGAPKPVEPCCCFVGCAVM
uniref:uncharacterized protein LOC120337503 n=1 Tax=Styela clava TaxID=7725 RepID=UPI001939F47B|nr:uncharacterized protein LOC120337503 [Styela clava]